MIGIRTAVLTLSAIGLVAGAGVATSTAQAATASHHPHPTQILAKGAKQIRTPLKKKDGSGFYCDPETVNLCLSSDGTAGDPVYTRTGPNSASVSTISTSTCVDANGVPIEYVQDGQQGDGPACPFTNGSGLNSTYEGREIVHFRNTGGECFGADSLSGHVNQRGCGSSGIDWVRAGSGPYYEYINVKASNAGGAADTIWTDGTAGDQAYINFISGAGQQDRWART